MKSNTVTAKKIAVLILALAAQAPAVVAQETWPYEYLRGEFVVPCPDKSEDSCIYHRLIVDNQSDATLECHGKITYSGANRDQQSTKTHHSVVDAKTRKPVLGDTTSPDINAISHSMNCKVRPPLDDSKLTNNCKPTITQKPTGSIDYPNDSRSAGEEGPVMLEFSFSDKEGAPTNIVVVGSSLWPKLDASAAKYVEQYKGLTDCKTGRFRIPLTFRLRE